MKLQNLLEAYKIPYDSTKKKNSAIVSDFVKLNSINKSDILIALQAIKKSKEFKQIIDLGYEYSSTALQENRGTLFFTALDGNSQVTCYVTGQARTATRGGFDNSQFMASPIPTEPPTQIGDLPNIVDVLIENLKNHCRLLTLSLTNEKIRMKVEWQLLMPE